MNRALPTRHEPAQTTPARRPLLVAIALIAGLVASIGASSPTAAASSEQLGDQSGHQILPGRIIVDGEPGASGNRVLAPSEVAEELLVSAPNPQALAPAQPLIADISNGIRLCFDATTPAAVQASAVRAGEMWANALTVDGPTIEVDVEWIPFRSPRSLGAAGPSTFVIHDDLPSPGVRYPVALANELLDTDFMVREPCGAGSDAEILLFLNSNAGGGSLWHFGDGPPADGAVDLTSVVAHEIAHGLGFTGSAERTAEGQLAWPDDGGAPYIFDRHVASCTATPVCELADLQPIGVGNLGALTSEALWYDAVGSPLELHAPAAWDVGSSFSHLSDTAYPASTGISLMTPYFERGEHHRQIDGATMAVLQKLGWSSATTPTSTAAVDVVALDGAVRLVLNEPDLSAGAPPTSHIVRIERETIVGGVSTFELAFEPVEIAGTTSTIRGLENDAFYRLSVQGTNATGLGPIVVSRVFSPGANPVDPAIVELARNVFESLRERPGSALEIDRLARSIETNGAAIAVASLLEAPEFADHQAIVRLYLGFLDRAPETAGIEFWIDQRRAGQDLTTIATRFAAASSFELGTSLTDQGFVERVYETILGRPAELEGLVFWVGRLNDGMPRGRLLLEVSESIEHRATNGARSQVIAAYVQFADRVPTAAELDAGLSLVEQNRFSALIGQLVSRS